MDGNTNLPSTVTVALPEITINADIKTNANETGLKIVVKDIILNVEAKDIDADRNGLEVSGEGQSNKITVKAGNVSSENAMGLNTVGDNKCHIEISAGNVTSNSSYYQGVYAASYGDSSVKVTTGNVTSAEGDGVYVQGGVLHSDGSSETGASVVETHDKIAGGTGIVARSLAGGSAAVTADSVDAGKFGIKTKVTTQGSKTDIQVKGDVFGNEAGINIEKNEGETTITIGETLATEGTAIILDDTVAAADAENLNITV